MAIILRTVKGTSLTYEEMDDNLSQFAYSGSVSRGLNQHILALHYTGSAGLGYVPRTASIDINPFPFRGSAQITGSLNVTGSVFYNGELLDTLFASNVSGGLGISVREEDSTSVVSLSTGSVHFQEAVYNFGLFRETGSFWNTTNNVGITGSFVVNLDGVSDTVSFDVAGEKQVEINNEGILILGTQSAVPTATAGGFYYGSDNIFYLGFS
jgi:hypothetical protein